MDEQMKPEVNAIEITDELIKANTYEIRGQKVMLDSDLALIYGYETKNFNRQVKNNIEKFPEDFMFQLTEDEILRCKNFTSSWGGSRYLPYAFTEQGIYMLMTVLKGDLAVKQSIALIRTFRTMKDYILENQGLIGQREYLQLSMQISDNMSETILLKRDLCEVEEKVAQVVDKLSDVVYKSELSDIMTEFGEPQIKRGYLILDGQPFKADLAYAEIYSRANKSIYIVDNYIGVKTLEHLIASKPGIKIVIYSDNLQNCLRKAVYDDFCREYPNMNIVLRMTKGCFHDRYIFLDYGTDDEKVFHCGASSKDAGIRTTSITTINDSINYGDVMKKLASNPLLVLK